MSMGSQERSLKQHIQVGGSYKVFLNVDVELSLLSP